jgi:hypothetical protein
MSKKPAPTPTPAAAPLATSAEIKVGVLAADSTAAALRVDFPGNAAGPLPARSLVPLDDDAVSRAVASRQPVVLLFENGDQRLPIIAGLLQAEPGAALLGSLLHGPPQAAAASVPTRGLEARLDGKRVVLEGEHEVVLRCGEASVTLRRDGKIILRGAYIETTAKGVNRIRGGSVKIN